MMLAALPLGAQMLKVDHVTVAGQDLRAMQQALQASGIASENGGPHANHATEMALTSFPDGSYLELIAIQKQADPAAVAAHAWSKFLKGNAGPCAWAVRPADIAAEAKRLHAGALTRSGRTRPDGVRLDWETAQVGPGNGTFFPFLIHDFTPRELRAYPSGKPTTTTYKGVTKVFLAVKDLDAAVAQFEKAYGLGSPLRRDDAALGAKLAVFDGTPVVLAAPIDARSWIAQRLEQFGEAPCAFVLGRAKPSKEITWLNASKLGWRLGVE